MAPKKRSRSDDQAVKLVTTSSRVTRSSTARQVNPKASTPPVKKKAKTKVELPVTKPAEAAKVDEVAAGSKTIVIEHCKQCNQFKTRAIKVKDALEKDISGITVLVNPEKPRRGCFEVREEGGEKFISLLDIFEKTIKGIKEDAGRQQIDTKPETQFIDMKRPFAPMRALDMDKVISDIMDKIQSA